MNYLFDDLGVQSHAGALGAVDPAAVDVVGGLQVAKAMQKGLIESWLGQLFFMQPSEADASHQRYAAVPCDQVKGAGGNCDVTALATLQSAPPGSVVLANLKTANPSLFVDVIVAASQTAAKQYAAPGSDYVVIQGVSVGSAKKETKAPAGPIIAGALVGGGIGFFTPLGPAGAAAGAGAGALVGWWLGKDDDKKAA